MLHIILLILKIIGIVLLSILGLLIAVILLVLFVPIRYRIFAEKQKSMGADIKAGWLFRGLYFKAEYRNEKFIYFVKVLGFTIKTNLLSEKKKHKRKPESKKAAKKTKVNNERQVVHKERQIIHKEQQVVSIEPNPLSKQENQIKKIQQTSQPSQIKQVQQVELDNKKLLDSRDKRETQEEQSEEKEWFLFRWWRQIQNKVGQVVHKLKEIYNMVKHLWKNLKDKVKSGTEFFEQIYYKISLARDFFGNEINKQGIKETFTSVKKVLKHIAPKKIVGSIRFGTGDPCSTGQALGAASLAYAYCGGSIEIIPDFENEILEGFLKAKGRIRIGTLLIIGIKLLLNDNFKKLVNNFKRFKEEL